MPCSSVCRKQHKQQSLRQSGWFRRASELLCTVTALSEADSLTEQKFSLWQAFVAR